MPIKHHSATGNGKIHSSRVKFPSAGAQEAIAGKSQAGLSTRRLNVKLSKRVRDLAHRERTSQSAIIECALWLFFQKGNDAKVISLMERAGIQARRRRS